MVTYCKAFTDAELEQILALQAENLMQFVSASRQQSDGFVTLKHDFDLLKRMNNACAHIVAKEGDRVVGFALSMLSDFRSDIPLLEGMFQMADGLYPAKKYLVMGQVCVAQSHRGKGVFRGLYSHMKACYNKEYDLLITIVAKKNSRSLSAHKAVGFRAIPRNTDIDWVFVVWDWNA